MKLRALVSYGVRLMKTNIRMASTSTQSPQRNIKLATIEENSSTIAMYGTLRDLCQNNVNYFKADDSDNGQRLHEAFNSIICTIDDILPMVDQIRKVAPSFDFDENTPGNGYRSFINNIDACVLLLMKLCRQVCISRSGILFRKPHYAKEVEACSQLLASLGSCLHHLNTLLSWSDPGELFPDEKHSPEELLASADTINQYSFYGRCLGFQFSPAMRSILKGISICMAGFSEAYYGKNHILSSVLAGGKFMIDPELRARRIVNISQNASIEFCKSFWFLSESAIMQTVPSLVSSSVSINKLIPIPPEPIEVTRNDDSIITIQPPDDYIGPQTLNVRLISKTKRIGMFGEAGGKPKSRGLLFHCHGGGFVAQSSASHEVYLREWASILDVPLVSIDYSLAPRAPFPRAMNEVLFAYCWVLKNASLLGTTAERIVMVGDSAGANLNMSTCLKLIAENIKLPHGIFLAYAPMLVNFIPSPARLLCLMDPLLPFGFMMRCLKAYATPPADSYRKKSNGLMNGSYSQDKNYLHPSISQVTPTNEDRSQQCVSDFLDKYVLESDTDSEGQKIPVLKKKPSDNTGTESPESATLTEGKSLVDTKSVSDGSGQTLKAKKIQTRISEAAESIVETVSSKFSNLTSNENKSDNDNLETIPSNLDSLIAKSPTDEFQFTVPKNPYLSPYWASDASLMKVPPTSILTVHLDPCLDDCVMFAKKLKRLGKPVTLDILDELPHGFLNFSKISKEAHEGSLQCIKRIADLMDLGSLPPQKD